ncbi:MAG: phospholipase D/transphosphatidylase [Bacillales bacterium]|jgi:cardiolipin synthase|nr:phospholipase D/transphosphatidylase [Bacillales bacterium]
MIIFLLIALLIAWFFYDLKIAKRPLHNRNYPFRFGDYQFYVEGKKLFEEFFRDIQNAQSEILIHFYIVKRDWLSEEFMRLLIDKAENGIKVKLMLDWFGSFFINRKWIKSLKKAGGEVRFSYAPKFPHIFQSILIRNHQKIAVIDGYNCYIGGLNVGKEYVDEHPKLTPWRDYHLKISGDIGKDFVREFNDIWNGKTSSFENNQKLTGDIQLIPYDNGSMEKQFLAYFGSANKKISIGTPYFFPTESVFNSLLSALNRGVQIEVLVPYLQDHLLCWEASIPYLSKLISNGASVYQYKNGFYHSKFLSVDSLFVEIGTFNFNKRSFLLNEEINCKFINPSTVEFLQKKFQEDIMDSDLLHSEKFSHLSVSTKTKILLAKGLSNYM